MKGMRRRLRWEGSACCDSVVDDGDDEREKSHYGESVFAPAALFILQMLRRYLKTSFIHIDSLA